MTRSRQPKARGFALLVVVLLVALIAVAAVALLDLVRVDLTVVGQHRRSTEAESSAVGAMVEVVSDDLLPQVLPSVPDPTNLPGLSYKFAGKQAGTYFRDPLGVPTAMDATNSAYVRDVGTNLEVGYEAYADLIRVSNPRDVGLTRSQALTYELSVVSSVVGGEATREVRTQVERIVATQSGTILTSVHAR